ncbi:hypothetical protein L484_007998 [Morus notabilis]|uniref:Uncharacterized protein n=1 Tax=Morus notabilis TaxID=981085 RepID=W9R761_9ROSA|nr:hypothetical protein L484_007998 [Morus notabilis]
MSSNWYNFTHGSPLDFRSDPDTTRFRKYSINTKLISSQNTTLVSSLLRGHLLYRDRISKSKAYSLNFTNHLALTNYAIAVKYKAVVVPARSRVALLLCNPVLAYVISHGKICFSRKEVHESMRSLVLVKENGRLPSSEYVAGINTTDKSQQDCRKAVRRFSRWSENYGREERESMVRERMRKSEMSTKEGKERTSIKRLWDVLF